MNILYKTIYIEEGRLGGEEEMEEMVERKRNSEIFLQIVESTR